jgi:hypothetical protein
VNPVNHIRVHVLVVASGVVTHGIHHHGRMILRSARIEFCMARVAIGRVGVGGLPIVMAENAAGLGDTNTPASSAALSISENPRCEPGRQS